MLKYSYYKFFFSVQILYLILLCLLSILPFWPRPLWWLANLIGIAPLWVWLLPLAALLPAALILKDRNSAVLGIVSLLIVFFGVMGYRLPLPRLDAPSAKAGLPLKVITANLGHISGLGPFLKLVEAERPDLIAFQELSPALRQELAGTLRASGWDVESSNHSGLASRYRIILTEALSRRPWGGWGNFVTRYQVQLPAGPAYFFVLHLATSRDGVEAVISRDPRAVLVMQAVTGAQEREARAARDLAARFAPAMVLGDLNMPVINPIYREYWSGYRNAFSDKGAGFGYTKHTRWYGARIDHVLTDPSWRIIEARVGPDVGGDHHPLIVRVDLPNPGG